MRLKKGHLIFPLIVCCIFNYAHTSPVSRSSRMVREVYPEVEQDLPVPVAQESTVGSQAKEWNEEYNALGEPSNGLVCIVGDVVYGIGENVPSEQPCLKCTCTAPGVDCETLTCHQQPGCRAIHRPNKCCPDYQCECNHEGKTYANGERLPSASGNECHVCYCRGGELQCAEVGCYTRDDCEPSHVPGQCCPRYDHCPPREPMSDRIQYTTEAPAVLKTEQDTLTTWIVTSHPENATTPQMETKVMYADEGSGDDSSSSEQTTSNTIGYTTSLKIEQSTPQSFSIKEISKKKTEMKKEILKIDKQTQTEDDRPKITIQEVIPQRTEYQITSAPKDGTTIKSPIKIIEDSSNELVDSQSYASEKTEVYDNPPPVLRIGEQLLFFKQGQLVQEKDASTPSPVITIIGAEGLQIGVGSEEIIEHDLMPSNTEVPTTLNPKKLNNNLHESEELSKELKNVDEVILTKPGTKTRSGSKSDKPGNDSTKEESSTDDSRTSEEFIIMREVVTSRTTVNTLETVDSPVTSNPKKPLKPIKRDHEATLAKEVNDQPVELYFSSVLVEEKTETSKDESSIDKNEEGATVTSVGDIEVTNTKVEASATKSEASATKSEASATKSDASARKPELSVEKNEAPAPKPEVTTQKNEEGGQKHEINTQKSEVLLQEPVKMVPGDKGSVETSEGPKIADHKTEASTESEASPTKTEAPIMKSKKKNPNKKSEVSTTKLEASPKKSPVSSASGSNPEVPVSKSVPQTEAPVTRPAITKLQPVLRAQIPIEELPIQELPTPAASKMEASSPGQNHPKSEYIPEESPYYPTLPDEIISHRGDHEEDSESSESKSFESTTENASSETSTDGIEVFTSEIETERNHQTKTRKELNEEDAKLEIEIQNDQAEDSDSTSESESKEDVITSHVELHPKSVEEKPENDTKIHFHDPEVSSEESEDYEEEQKEQPVEDPKIIREVLDQVNNHTRKNFSEKVDWLKVDDSKHIIKDKQGPQGIPLINPKAALPEVLLNQPSETDQKNDDDDDDEEDEIETATEKVVEQLKHSKIMAKENKVTKMTTELQKSKETVEDSDESSSKETTTNKSDHFDLMAGDDASVETTRSESSMDTSELVETVPGFEHTTGKSKASHEESESDESDDDENPKAEVEMVVTTEAHEMHLQGGMDEKTVDDKAKMSEDMEKMSENQGLARNDSKVGEDAKSAEKMAESGKVSEEMSVEKAKLSEEKAKMHGMEHKEKVAIHKSKATMHEDIRHTMNEDKRYKMNGDKTHVMMHENKTYTMIHDDKLHMMMMRDEPVKNDEALEVQKVVTDDDLVKPEEEKHKRDVVKKVLKDTFENPKENIRTELTEDAPKKVLEDLEEKHEVEASNDSNSDSESSSSSEQTKNDSDAKMEDDIGDNPILGKHEELHKIPQEKLTSHQKDNSTAEGSEEGSESEANSSEFDPEVRIEDDFGDNPTKKVTNEAPKKKQDVIQRVGSISKLRESTENLDTSLIGIFREFISKNQLRYTHKINERV